MKVKVGLVLFLSLVVCAASYADTITFAGTPGALGANDSATWGQLGSDGTVIPNTFSATSGGGDAITGSFATTTGLVATVGSSWGPASGPFSNGDSLIWSFDSSANNGTGPLTLDFPAVFGVGAAIQSDAPGQFEAELDLYGSQGLLQKITALSDTNGDAIFIGGVDNVQGITSAVFKLDSVATNPNNESNNLGDFAIDTLYLQNGSVATPEPGSLLLVGGGLMTLGLRRLSKKQS